jgi:hypothetical protein
MMTGSWNEKCSYISQTSSSGYLGCKMRRIFLSKKSKVFLTVLSFVLFLPALSFSLGSYDDFSGASIDKTKWVQREWVYAQPIHEIRKGVK